MLLWPVCLIFSRLRVRSYQVYAAFALLFFYPDKLVTKFVLNFRLLLTKQQIVFSRVVSHEKLNSNLPRLRSDDLSCFESDVGIYHKIYVVIAFSCVRSELAALLFQIVTELTPVSFVMFCHRFSPLVVNGRITC